MSVKGEKKEKKKYKQEGEETEENEREIKTSISKKMTTLKKQVNLAWEPTLVKTELVSTHEYDEDYIQMFPLCKGTQVLSSLVENMLVVERFRLRQTPILNKRFWFNRLTD